MPKRPEPATDGVVHAPSLHVLDLLLYTFFFFSSRRRHTRSLCDWSSDVCSSDLRHAAHGAGLVAGYGASCRPTWPATKPAPCAAWRPARRRADRASSRPWLRLRSEERRVGEEGRSRWAPDH